MKTFTAISVFVLTLITASAPARASDSNGRGIAFGRGMEPCSTQVTSSGLSLEAITWTGGFLSAYNYMADDTYDITGLNNKWDGWIAEFCRMNPHVNLVKAVAAYTDAAYPTRLVTRPPVTTPPAPQQRAVKNRNRY